MSAPLYCKQVSLIDLLVRLVLVLVIWEERFWKLLRKHWKGATPFFTSVYPNPSPLSSPQLPPSSCHVALELTPYSLETFGTYCVKLSALVVFIKIFASKDSFLINAVCPFCTSL